MASNGRAKASPRTNGGVKVALSAARSELAPSWENTDMGCVSTSAGGHLLGQRPKRKDEGILESIRSWVASHQIGLSINILALLAITHLAFPRARSHTSKFFQLQYYDAPKEQYLRGPDDFYYIMLWAVIFTGLRDATLNYFLLPAATALGIRKKKKQVRFAEQAWLLIYYCVLWSLGMYIISQQPYFTDFSHLWRDFPVRHMSTLFKHYYLIQFGFWIQQIVVVNIEERRKDHWQMFTHHIVTCLLLLCSYGYYQTRAGNVILCIMDLVDITLPAAKLLKYAGYQLACDIAFGVFILSWFLSRHVVYMMLVWSIWFHVPQTMVEGCYSTVTGEMLGPAEEALIPQSKRWGVLPNMMQPYLEPNEPICFHYGLRTAFLWLLGGLQVITIMWFMLILKVAYRVLRGHGADDNRSDDEDEAEDDALPGPPEFDAPPLEMEVGVEGLNLKSSSVRHRKGAHRGPNGLSLTGHSDKKELLGRIGCDKPT